MSRKIRTHEENGHDRKNVTIEEIVLMRFVVFLMVMSDMLKRTTKV